MKTDKQGINHISEAEIVERGWTKSGVTKFLGEPDWRPNFRAYGQTLQWRLYQEDRVIAMELTDEWKIWRVKSEKRRESARKTALNKIAETEIERLTELQNEEEAKQEYLKDISAIKVHFLGKLPDINKLRELGEKHWVPATYQDPSFKETTQEHSDRITVNYIRHHLTNYDDILENYNINDHGYPILTQKIHALIGNRFPELKESCEQRIVYASGKSLQYQSYYESYQKGEFYDNPEPKHLTSPEMQEKRAQTMVSIDEQKRLGLI